MFWQCEGMKTAFEGKVVLNGEEYLVSKEDSYGYADKIWGRDFTNPWVWLSSNDLTRKSTGEKLTDSAFVIGGGRPKVGSRTLENQLMGAMWYEGEAFEFNFAKVWTLTKTKFKCKEIFLSCKLFRMLYFCIMDDTFDIRLPGQWRS